MYTTAYLACANEAYGALNGWHLLQWLLVNILLAI